CNTIEGVKDSLFRRLRYSLDRSPIDSDIDEHWCAWDIKIPDTVMDQLVMPLPLPGLQIHGHERFTKQAVAGTMTAVNIAGRQLDGEICHSQFLIDADLSPYAGIANGISGFVEPRVVAEFPTSRYRVEYPQAFPGPNIESPNIAFGIVTD